MGAGSRALSTRPHLPTTDSTSGMAFMRWPKILQFCIFFSTPLWGILVGMSMKVPSSKVGMNSLPVFVQIIPPAIRVNMGIDINFHRWFKHQRRICSYLSTRSQRIDRMPPTVTITNSKLSNIPFCGPKGSHTLESS